MYVDDEASPLLLEKLIHDRLLHRQVDRARTSTRAEDRDAHKNTMHPQNT